ncbi:MAG: energy transducer TonB [Bacteroidota bacterium]
MMTFKRFLFFVAFVAILFVPQKHYGQDEPAFEFVFEVKKVYPPVSISKNDLDNANSLIDLNKRYEQSWVREYKMVEITAVCNGELQKAIGPNDILTQDQKDLMFCADPKTNIFVRVEYIPENNLSIREVKEMDFSFTLQPSRDAEFVGGPVKLKKYLEETVLKHIDVANFKQYQLAAYKFTIDADGHVLNPTITSSSEDEATDQLLINAICNMPLWEPAKFYDRSTGKQEFVLAVGDMNSCVVPLLSINQ